MDQERAVHAVVAHVLTGREEQRAAETDLETRRPVRDRETKREVRIAELDAAAVVRSRELEAGAR